MFSDEQMAAIRAWAKADADIQSCYASCDPRDPTRVIVEVDGERCLVELSRQVLYGNPMVVARRLKIHGE